MGYDVEFKEAIRDYIANLDGLTDADRVSIIDGVIEELSQRADEFLDQHPLGHESLHFRYDYAHPTFETMFAFEFVVDASHREMGVIVVEFVECKTSPMSDLGS